MIELTPDQLATFDSLGEEDNNQLASELAGVLDGFVPQLVEDEYEDEPAPSPAFAARAKLAAFENAPTEEELQAWIAKYGEEGVFLVSLAPEDTFVLRPLSAGEHRLVLAAGQRGRASIQEGDYVALAELEEKLKFLLIKTCMLWHPDSPAQFSEAHLAKRRAGLLNNLVTVVNINSYFFEDPQQILSFTTILR